VLAVDAVVEFDPGEAVLDGLPADELAVVDDGLPVVGDEGLAVVDDGLDVLRAPPGADGDVVWVGVPDVGRVVSAMKSSANPTGKTSRKPCV